jgi:hypothetical protein
MALKEPVFPKTLTLAGWRIVTKKESIAAVSDVEDALETLERAFKKIKWDEPELDLGTLPKTLKTLIVEADKQKALKGKSAAKTLKSAAKDFLDELESFLAATEKAAAAAAKEAANEEDDEDEEEEGEGYNLKLQLKRARKRPLKFAFIKGKSELNQKIRYQVFLDKKKLNKARVKKEFGEEYPSLKLLAVGIVSFADKVFTFASKQPPKDAWQKLLTKSFKIQKCLVLGTVLFRSLKKGEDPELDADTDEVDVVEIDPADLRDDDLPENTPDDAAPDATPDAKAEALAAALAQWKKIRLEVRKNLTALGAAIAGAEDPDAREAVIKIRALLAQISESPDNARSVAEVRRYLETDDIIDDIESPNPFGIKIDIRKSLLAALAPITDAL